MRELADVTLGTGQVAIIPPEACMEQRKLVNKLHSKPNRSPAVIVC